METGSLCWVTTAYADFQYVGIMDTEFDNASVLHMKSSAYNAMDHRFKPVSWMLSKFMAFDEQRVQDGKENMGPADEDIIAGTCMDGEWRSQRMNQTSGASVR